MCFISFMFTGYVDCTPHNYLFVYACNDSITERFHSSMIHHMGVPDHRPSD